MRSATKQMLKDMGSRAGLHIQRINDLTRHANRVNSDKGTKLHGHLYTIVYDRLFAARRLDALTLVEIGLLRVNDTRRDQRSSNAAEGASDLSANSAPSLEVWRAYFPNARLIGFDIDDFSSVKIDRCQILRGDMSSPRDLAQVAKAADGRIDILIDDASHASHHQQITLRELFAAIAPGGWYIIEDLHFQEPAFEREGIPKTRDILRHWQLGLTQRARLL